MCTKKSRLISATFTILVALLSSFYSVCSASTAGETVQIPRKSLIELSKITNEQDQLLTQLEANLTAQEKTLKEQAKSLNGLSSKLKIAEKSLTDSKLIIAEQERSLKKLSDSIKKQKRNRLVGGVIGILIGVLIGTSF